MIGMFFLGASIMIFLGILGEYILSINQRVMNRPLVIEEERINFDEKDERMRINGKDKTEKESRGG